MSAVWRLVAAAGAVYRRAGEDLEILRAALLAPVQRRCDSHDVRLDDLDETLSNAPKRRRGQQA